MKRNYWREAKNTVQAIVVLILMGVGFVFGDPFGLAGCAVESLGFVE